ncbi:hypothetical protein EW026_g494 [Hermanssonia centrifuga]|uniref:SMP-LTD domain-containing protein n=1 Tax=Hermanssonia centrifuga TaxID=98765 RepID=A0A4S4KUD6_9APHY|nr:hypothetical protein EW026_g494 [Hermanssonia centrifuga]
MSLRALLYAYVLGGLTFIPLLILGVCFYIIYTSVPVGDPNVDKILKGKLEHRSQALEDNDGENEVASSSGTTPSDVNDLPKARRSWLTVRRTFEETASDGSYVTLVRGFLDARSKDPKRSRPKDMWYVVLKGKVLYLYEDESMTECEAAIELGSHDVVIYPEDLLDGELFAKRNAVCLKPRIPPPDDEMPSVTKEMISVPDYTDKVLEKGGSTQQKEKDQERAQESEKQHEEARQEALSPSTPWFIFVRSNVEMEDWYLSLVHASDNPPNSPTLAPLHPVFQPADMLHLVETLDEQPDVIPMRWLNALIGRLFFSFYRTQTLESYIIGRLMRKLSKIKRPSFLTDLVVREVSVGNKAPTLSKPMLKELTKEGDASLEVHLHYKGEIRITVDATATINLGARFKSYTVKLVLAAVLREMEGNLLVKVKRPPSNRLWYAFTQTPRMVLDVEPVVSDRQITWGMILGTIESRLKEVIQESIVLPNMDDIAFFESSKYKHRGGIWADASRAERSPELHPMDAEAAGDDHPPASAPASDTSTPLAEDLELVGLQRSHSAPGETVATDPAESPDAAVDFPMSRATTIAGSSLPPNPSARRRSWFSSADGSNAEEVIERGRSNGSESTMTRRSSSTPSDHPEAPVPDDVAPQPDESNIGDDIHLTPDRTRRSSSQHSRASSSRSAYPSSVDGSSTSPPSESLFASFRSKSPAQSLTGKTLPNSPTSNFFQSLKTRDKQAISNSAKEAIRKWGVNWVGIKKDQPGSGDEDADGEERRQNEPKMQKPRPNYTEVRAAVEQRKTPQPDATSEVAFEPLDPPATPENAKGKARAVSVSSSNDPANAPGYSADDVSTSSTSPRLDTLAPNAQVQSRSASPSLQAPTTRPRTTSHLSQSGLDSGGLPNEDETPTQPIHTQPPPPKSMTIPGIHASHRGEVMSMGYAPPPPPPSEQKKGPAIQSVYRLWKNPGNQQGQQQSEPGSQPQTQTGFAGRDQDDALVATSLSSSGPSEMPSPAVVPARPAPPPLPPRSRAYSTHAVQLASEPPKHPPGLDRSSPPASATLQSIVSKDNNKRASLDPSISVVLGPSGSGDVPLSNGEQVSPAIPATLASNDGDGEPVKPRPPALPPRRSQVPSA